MVRRSKLRGDGHFDPSFSPRVKSGHFRNKSVPDTFTSISDNGTKLSGQFRSATDHGTEVSGQFRS